MLSFVKTLVVVASAFVASLVDGHEDCTDLFVGKEIQMEYRYPGFEGYWMTLSSNSGTGLKTQWIRSDQVSDPEQGFSWRVHQCALDNQIKPNACFESLYYVRHFMQESYYKKVENDVALQSDTSIKFRIQCKSCSNPDSCELVSVAKGCKLYSRNYMPFVGHVVFCGVNDDPSWYEWRIKYNGSLNGIETTTLETINNCPPGKGELLQKIWFDEGILDSSRSGKMDLKGLNEFLSSKLDREAAALTPMMSAAKHTMKKGFVTVKVEPGQTVTVQQTTAHYGNLVLKSEANVTTSNCLTAAEERAFDEMRTTETISNCSPGSAEIVGKVRHRYGLYQRGSNHAEDLSANSAVVAAIVNAIRISYSNGTVKSDWLTMDLWDLNDNNETYVDIEITPGKQLNISQLVLNYGAYTLHSRVVSYQLHDCPGWTQTQALTNDLLITGTMIGALCFIAVVVILVKLNRNNKVAFKCPNQGKVTGTVIDIPQPEILIIFQGQTTPEPK